jgi:release factor glutamine methyltransferase
MTIKRVLQWAREQLVNCERPQYEAELLLAYLLKRDRNYLFTNENKTIDIKEYEKLVKRRQRDEPYEYIVGEASFYDVMLKVQKGVLIPRPETEILIDIVADIIKKENIVRIAEIGVGSGAISIALCRKFPHLKSIATDISEEALKVAEQNIKKYKLQEQIFLLKSNLIDEITDNVELIVSNPPYIAEDFLLEPNVVDYEPKEALFGGKRGDEMLRQIILDVKTRGIKWLACEMGYDQKAYIQEFVNEVGVKSIEFYKDLAGLDRGFVICFVDEGNSK